MFFFLSFCQCIIQLIQKYELKSRYESDPESVLSLRMLAALAYVPAIRVVVLFEELIYSNLMPSEAQSAIGYFEDCWFSTSRHPYFWKFIDCLKKEQTINEAKIEMYIAGHSPIPGLC